MHSVNWIEILAVVTGFIAIYFQIKAKVVYWPISILNVLLYIIIFFSIEIICRNQPSVLLFNNEHIWLDFLGKTS